MAEPKLRSIISFSATIFSSSLAMCFPCSLVAATFASRESTSLLMKYPFAAISDVSTKTMREPTTRPIIVSSMVLMFSFGNMPGILPH